MYLNVPLKLKPTDDILYDDHALTMYTSKTISVLDTTVLSY